MPRARERRREIHRDGGLADAALAAGDGDDLHRVGFTARITPEIRYVLSVPLSRSRNACVAWFFVRRVAVVALGDVHRARHQAVRARGLEIFGNALAVAHVRGRQFGA